MHAEHDEALRVVRLETAVAIREAALGGGARRCLERRPIEHVDALAAVGDLLAVGADVLDRRGSGPAGDAAQALESLELAFDAVAHDVVPRLPRGYGERRAIARVAKRSSADRGAEHEPVEALIGDD